MFLSLLGFFVLNLLLSLMLLLLLLFLLLAVLNFPYFLNFFFNVKSCHHCSLEAPNQSRLHSCRQRAAPAREAGGVRREMSALLPNAVSCSIIGAHGDNQPNHSHTQFVILATSTQKHAVCHHN